MAKPPSADTQALLDKLDEILEVLKALHRHAEWTARHAKDSGFDLNHPGSAPGELPEE